MHNNSLCWELCALHIMCCTQWLLPSHWVLGPTATVVYKRLASRIAEKHDRAYGKTLHLIRCRLNFSLLRSAIMCLRGSRSATHRPASPLSGDIIDLSSAEGRVPNEDWTFPCLCTWLVYYYYTAYSCLLFIPGSAHVCLCKLPRIIYICTFLHECVKCVGCDRSVKHYIWGPIWEQRSPAEWAETTTWSSHVETQSRKNGAVEMDQAGEMEQLIELYTQALWDIQAMDEQIVTTQHDLEDTQERLKLQETAANELQVMRRRLKLGKTASWTDTKLWSWNTSSERHANPGCFHN